MQEKKEKFYVFLDFDGVLYDIKEVADRTINKKGKLLSFSKDSIDALNLLFDRLSIQYDPELVISSTWRIFMSKAVKALENSGFDFKDYAVSRTPSQHNPYKRAGEIMAFLKERENPENYVIIDDGIFDYPKFDMSKNLIRTNIINGRLKIEDVEKYLSRFKDSDDFVSGM